MSWSRPADFGRVDRRRGFRPKTAAEPHCHFIPMSPPKQEHTGGLMVSPPSETNPES